MKTGNLLSLILVTFLLAGAIACDLLLAAQYKKTDLADPYKNFETVPVRSFRKLSITGGNGYAIQLQQGEQFSLRLMKSRKSFFSLQQSEDSLALSFKVANQTYQKPGDCIVGLIITAPLLNYLKLTGANMVLTGFDSDRLFIQLDSSAQLRCSKLKIEHFFIEAARGASIDFQQLNHVDLLSLKLNNHASATLSDVVCNKFEQSVSDSASIRFYGNSLKQFLTH